VEAYKNQQFRWAKGSFQVVRKILPRLMDSTLPWHIRLLALLHITGYGVHPLMLAILILTLPVGLYAPHAFRLFPLSIVAGFGPPLVYLSAKASHSPSLSERLRLLPLLTITGFGLCLNTTVAVVEGLLGKGGVFIRTPKLNLLDSKRNKPVDKGYIAPVSPLVWLEIILGLYALLTGVVLAPLIGWGIIPWMVIYMLGFFYVAGLSLIQNRETSRKRLSNLAPEKSV
jgi:fatty acid desaturase